MIASRGAIPRKRAGRRAACAALLCLLTALAADGLAQDDKVQVGATVQTGTILGVRDGRVRLKGPRGELAIDLKTVRGVEKVAPPELAQAVAAFAAGKPAEALPLAQKITETFKGLPVPWVSEALSLHGDALVALGKFAEAEKVYQDLQTFYPAEGGALPPRAQVGLAQVALERQKSDEARKLLESLKETALNELNVLADQGKIYGQVFFLLGRLDEAEGKESQALENYLRTVTIFYHDPIVTARAKERVDALAAKVTVP